MTKKTVGQGWFWRNLGYAFRNRGWVLFAIAVVMALFGAAAAVTAPLVARHVVDTLITPEGAASSLSGPIALLLGLAAVRLVAGYLRRRYASRVSMRVEYDLRREMFAAAQRLSPADGGRLDPGQVLTRSTSDLALEQELFGLMPLFALNSITLLLAIGVMFWLSPLLTVVVLLVVPALYLVTRRSQRAVFPAMWDAQNHLGKLTGFAHESVHGIGVVMGFGQEARAQAGFDAQARALFAARLRLARLAGRYLAALQSVPPFGQLGILALGGWMTFTGRIGVGTFVAFSAYLLQIAMAAKGYASAVVAIQQGKASVLRIFELLDVVPAVRERDDAVAPQELSGAVELSDVSFGYGSGPAALSGVTLRVEPGETVAVVGPSGSGKSTLAVLIGRFHDTGAGEVRVGGHDVRDLRLSALRRHVGIAFDDAFLFAGTVRENIAFGDPTAGDERIREAARVAAADDFIEELPDGYDTVIGERGATLSGGQRQRIALARTLLAEPDILVLDDATSAVDAAVEARILSGLAASSAGRTTLLITHRPAALAFADRICVLDQGRLVDTGTDRELRGRCPFYARLVGEHGELIDPARRTVGMLTRAEGEPGVINPMPRDAVQDALNSPPTTAAILSGVAALPAARDEPRTASTAGGTAWRTARLSALGLISTYRWLLLAAAALVALDTFTGLAQPVLVRRAIDAGIVGGRGDALIGTVAAAMLLLAIGWAGTLAQTRVTWRAAEEILYALRTRTFNRLLRLGMGYHEREAAGRALSTITVDVAAVASFAQTGVAAIAVGLVSMVGMIIVVAVLDAGLLLALVPVLAAVVLATLVLRTRSHHFYRLAQDDASQLAASLQENLNGSRVVHGLNRAELNRARYGELSDRYRRSRFRALMQGAALFSVTECLSTVAAVVVIGLGTGRVAAGMLSLGTLVAFLLYVDMLFGPIQQISQSFDSYQKGSIGLRRLRELDAVAATVAEPADAQPVGALTGRVELRGVGFRYPATRRDAVSDIDVTLLPGETVALVGETGSGKSTLLKLIARFYDPGHGAVAVDGIDIRRFESGAYRRRLGIVSQEPFLFAGTVRDNISYGRPEASTSDIVEITEAIGLRAVFEALKDGFETQVGPQGRALSAGQRQLVALARAHLVDPAILLLDEATAALDPDTEAAYQRAVSTLQTRRTTLMIAHRLTTAARADRILVLKAGRIVESGPQDELIAAGAEYARLWRAYQPALARREVSA